MWQEPLMKNDNTVGNSAHPICYGQAAIDHTSRWNLIDSPKLQIACKTPKRLFKQHRLTRIQESG
jgi:hypothetical protein